jgi:hypothetical protein
MSSDGALAATVCLMSRHQYKHGLSVYQVYHGFPQIAY